MSVVEKATEVSAQHPDNDISIKKSSILHGPLVFGLLSVLVYLVSFLKTLVVTRYFGTGAEMDAYAMAVLVPNLLATLLAGSCAASLVPVLARIEQSGRGERVATLRAAYLIFVGICACVSLGLFLFARPIMGHLATGFDAQRLDLAVRLLRLAAPFVGLYAAFAFASAEMLSRRKFAIVAGAPVIMPLVSLAFLLAFRSLGVSALVWGMVFGTALQALAFSIPVWSGPTGRSSFRLWTPSVQAMLTAHAPMILVSLFGVTNSFVDQAMAGFLPVGNVSALNYANTINGFVVQGTAMALSWVALPEFSSLAAGGNTAVLKDNARRWIRGALMVAAPVAALIFIGGKFAVRLVLQHGAFNAYSTHLVYQAWAGYTVGLLPLSVGIIGARLLNALRENSFLARMGLVTLVVNAGLDFVFMRYWGGLGIALSTSIVYCMTTLVIFRFLYLKIGSIFNKEIWICLGKVALACALASIPALMHVGRADSAANWLFRSTVFVAILLFLYARLKVVGSFRGMLASFR